MKNRGNVSGAGLVLMCLFMVMGCAEDAEVAALRKRMGAIQGSIIITDLLVRVAPDRRRACCPPRPRGLLSPVAQVHMS